MANSIPKPGVTVIQEFQTVTPTTVRPTLQACTVGVCRQIVEAVDGADLNADAKVLLPAFMVALAATGSPLAYNGLLGKHLDLSINNSSPVSVEFSSNSLSPIKAVADFAKAFAAENVGDAVAVLESDDRFRLQTVGKGDLYTLEVLPTSDPEVLDAFGFSPRIYTGQNAYVQERTRIYEGQFPDPRGNLRELDFEEDKTRLFFSLGGGSLNVREASRTSSYLRRAKSNTQAVLSGNVDLTGVTLANLANTTVNLRINKIAVAVVFTTAPANVAAILAAFNGAAGETIASLAPTTNYLLLTSNLLGGDGSVEVVSGTGTINPLTTLGLSVSEVDGLSTVSGVTDSTTAVTTNMVQLNGENFLSPGTTAVVDATVDITATYASLAGESIILSDGGPAIEYIFSTPASPAEVLAQLNAVYGQSVGGSLAFTYSSGSLLRITNPLKGEESVVRVLGGTSLAILGLTPELVGSVDLDGLTYPLSCTLQVRFGTTVLTATVTAAADKNAAVTQIDAAFSSLGSARLGTGDLLVVASADLSALEVVGGTGTNPATAATFLGLEVGETSEGVEDRGDPLPPMAGDQLWVDGAYYADIVKVSPGGVPDRLKINRTVPVSLDLGKSAYIIAMKLSQQVSTVSNRPTPELLLDGEGNLTVKPEIFRDTEGAPSLISTGDFYIQYSAVRLDVTSLANNRSLLRFNTPDEVAALIGPVRPDNPLAFACDLMVRAAPNREILALGVDETSVTEPYGTVDAFARAASFLENYRLYALAPLTRDETVSQIMLAHVLAMSEPEQKATRICLYALPTPTHGLDNLVSSGLNGESFGASGTQFDTKVGNLASLLLNAGVDPVGTIPTSAGAFLKVEGSNLNYSIQSINGPILTIRTVFGAGENDDDFYATSDLNDPPLPAILLNTTFSVFVRGKSLEDMNGQKDLNAIAEVLNERSAMGYGSSRFWNHVGDNLGVTVDGVEVLVPLFYACAVHAAALAAALPSQSFTNLGLAGFTRVTGTNDTFSESQLNLIAGGGNTILVQEVERAPITLRMALTTNTTSVEAYSDNIVKAVDYMEYFLRDTLRAYIGRYNISQGLLDTIGQVTESTFMFAAGEKIIKGGALDSVIQDPDKPDQTLLDTTLDVYYANNYIRLTLSI